MIWTKVLSINVIFLLIFMGASNAWANNMNIYNVKTSLVTSGTPYVSVTFNISWANSFKDATNYDAAWVFIKYTTDSGVTWNHATMHGDISTTTTLGTALLGTGYKGAFFYRSANATGTYSASIVMPWDYSTDSVDVSAILSKEFAIKVIGIEMVRIPTANFWVGDNTADDVLWDDGTFDSFQITTSPVTNVTNLSSPGNELDDLYNGGNLLTLDGDGGITASTLGDTNTGFPMGYNAFYLMKYEITEGLWVTFFNTLTDAQKANRDITSISGKNTDATVYRNTVSWDGSGDATTTRPDRAMHYLSWMDLCAIADWAALRPMSELEYEKAARGTTSDSAGEFAWGSSSATVADTITGSSEDGTETISTSSANVNSTGWTTAFAGGDTGKGPLRVGIFSTGSSTRTQSGSGFYGNMELTGNVGEMVVSLGNPQGRAFDGTAGDGVLTTTSGYEGNATNTDWPGIDATSARGVTGYLGSGIRGALAATLFGSPDGTLSARSLCPSNTSSRAIGNGGRLARSQ